MLKENSLRKRSFIYSSLNHFRSDKEKYWWKKPFIGSMGLNPIPFGGRLHPMTRDDIYPGKGEVIYARCTEFSFFFSMNVAFMGMLFTKYRLLNKNENIQPMHVPCKNFSDFVTFSFPIHCFS